MIATYLKDWLACVIQNIDPWLSSKDIDRGSQWFSEITSQLADISIGIVCLTQENKNRPWILFEAGALAKGKKTRVCTLLIDLENTDITDPLAQFNHTRLNKDDIRQLLGDINILLGDQALRDPVLDMAFNTFWPQFEERVAEILSQTEPEGQVSTVRSESELLTDVLNTVRGLDRRLQSLEIHQPSLASTKGSVSSAEALQSNRRPGITAFTISDPIGVADDIHIAMSEIKAALNYPSSFVLEEDGKVQLSVGAILRESEVDVLKMLLSKQGWEIHSVKKYVSRR